MVNSLTKKEENFLTSDQDPFKNVSNNIIINL